MIEGENGCLVIFFFNVPATPEFYTLSLPDALPFFIFADLLWSLLVVLTDEGAATFTDRFRNFSVVDSGIIHLGRGDEFWLSYGEAIHQFSFAVLGGGGAFLGQVLRFWSSGRGFIRAGFRSGGRFRGGLLGGGGIALG